MEEYDALLARRVWQRVQPDAELTALGTQRQDDTRLLALAAQELDDAAAYAALARRFNGAAAALLRRLSEQERAHAACLRGIYRMLGGSLPEIRGAQPADGVLDAMLRRRYGREAECIDAYERHASDKVYGAVFARLAEQERAHAQAVLELLGK